MTPRPHQQLFILRPRLIVIILAFCVLQLLAMPASAVEEYPLKPVDTSSPRATFQGFLELMDKGYQSGVGLIESYLASSRLYLTPDEIANIKDARHYQISAYRTLDLSQLPPVLAGESSRRLAILLKVILDRIDLPPLELIPDAQAMANSEFKHWTLPNTEIRIQRIEEGPRKGEYLFTPETLDRLPEFYAKIKDFPYKPGASVGWYDFSTYSPAGVALALYRIVPTRWLVDAPRYQHRFLLLDQPLWRWFGIMVILGTGSIFIMLCFRLARYLIRRPTYSGQWANILRPFSLMVVAWAAAFVLADILRISGSIYAVIVPSLNALFYLACTWMVWVAGGAIAANVISQEGLRIGSIDSQFIHLLLRLVTIIVAIAIIVTGADQLGLPAYSVIAGLGVGGLAVALAAQQTLANLLGSLIIMFERPFAVGDEIKLKDTAGIVEKVGFRSTRIRTFHNSIVTIPSSELVNSTIDNMALRESREVKTFLNLTYDTPVEKIERLIEGIKQIIKTHQYTDKDNIQVFLYEFGPYSLDILVKFFLQVPNRADELKERQQILLDILRLAEDSGVEFAFPTQTVHIMEENCGQPGSGQANSAAQHSKTT
ncbi:MAG: mechanosensitive ion channel family protein [Nitrosomonas sp.]|nr:mechanosensitive ion channel family protein [Nitrosomonas sp.]